MEVSNTWHSNRRDYQIPIACIPGEVKMSEITSLKDKPPEGKQKAHPTYYPRYNSARRNIACDLRASDGPFSLEIYLI